MNERLQLAKELLKDDGVIFVSIDDAEQAYLKVLMDEIFGEENFVTNFVWQKGGGKSDSKLISNKKEYIICFSKSINNLKFNKQNSPIKNYKFEDERGKYSLRSFDMQGLTYTKKLDYPIIAPDNTFIYPGKTLQKYLERQNGNFQKRDWRWTLSKDEFNKRLKNNEIEFTKKNNEWRVYYKSYHEGKTFPYSDLINDFGNQLGAIEIKQIFNTRIFDFPKPVNLIKFLINLLKNKNIRVLDFFAGSGTTAHAVLELNHEDGGNRTFTLVTNNENNIGIDVNYERLYRINHGVGTKNETFDWTKKYEPYKANLNVFNIKYYDISPANKDIEIEDLANKLIDVLKEFGITSIDKNNQQQYINLLNDLSSLKPEKREDNESN